MKQITSSLHSFLLLLFSFLFGMNSMVAQEATITGFNSDYPDGFGLLLLRDYSEGEHIFITDKDYVPATNSFDDFFNDFILRYTIPAGGLSKGTVVTIESGDPSAPVIVVSTGSVFVFGNGGRLGFSGAEPLSIFKSNNANDPLAGVIEIFGYFHGGDNCSPVPNTDGDCPCSSSFIVRNYCAESRDLDGAHYTGPRDNTTFAQFTDPDNWTTYEDDVIIDATPFTNLQFGTTTCNDIAPPVISCPTDQNRTLDNNCSYTLEDFTSLATNVSDDCTTSPILTQSPLANITSATSAGIIPVTLTATDSDNKTTSCTFNVIVNDSQAPNMVCNNFNLELTSASMTITPEQVDGGSTDNCGISNLSLDNNTFTCSALGAQTLVLTGTDAAGNSSSCNATITVMDNIPPVPICKTTTVEIQSGGTYTLQEADVYDANASTDNCSITNVSFTSSTYDCDDKGQSFTVGVVVTDMGGNTANCNASVYVAVNDALPDNWVVSDIGDSGSMGNNTSFDPCSSTTSGNEEFIITGGGNNATSSTTDNVAFAGQTICGDGTITAKIESVDANGYGGLMIRETTDAGAKQAAIFSNLSNILRHEARYTANGMKQVSSFFKPSPVWLRLQRQGDWIFAYYSSNGVNFQYAHGVMVSMQNCVEYGLASFTYYPGQQTNATFSNVTVIGASTTTAEVPGFIDHIPTVKLQQTPILYPNPATNIVNLAFPDGLNKAAIIVLRNQFGQAIEQRTLSTDDITTEWNVSALIDGMYFFEIYQDGEVLQILKLMKVR
ncbi:MAG: T9SS type A sorting domain-containing protein [Chitinophagales bacterium]|nr:T9SS type A sorting domain-containing protein [Chitinophagales bacterium]